MNLKIIIFSHNRPNYLKDCLEKFDEFNFPKFIISVFDNSDPKIQKQIKKLCSFHQINLIINKTTTFVEHLKFAIKFTESDYALFFHDDFV